MSQTRVAPSQSPVVVGAVSMGIALLAGAMLARHPIPAAAGLGALAATLVLALASPRVDRVFFVCLGALLWGYAFLGRGFAYVGAPPVFVGELTLVVGFLAVAARRGLRLPARTPALWLLAAFALWGAARTLPYLSRYGVDALRDAVLWGYGAFAVIVAGLVAGPDAFARLVRNYRRWLPWFLLWVPAVAVLVTFAGPMLPRTESGVTVPTFKPGDTAVHLAGVAAFLLVGLHHAPARDARDARPARRWTEVLLWAAWLVGALVVSASNRGGILAILASVLVVCLLQPTRAARRLVILLALGATLVAALAALDLSHVSFDQGGGRSLSQKQVSDKVMSIVSSGGPRGDLDDTRNWRILWWTDIVGYTVHGPYRWTGKGFGVNLADDDDFQVGDGTLRSPHSVHMSVLARSGVPGVVLWLLLQAAIGVSLLRAYWRAVRARAQAWAQLDLWLLAYWVAFLCDASFDVYLESPQGGIWFWTVVGLSVAAVAEQRHAVPVTATAPRAVPAGRLAMASPSARSGFGGVEA